MNASRYENQIATLTTKLQNAEKALAKEAAKVAQLNAKLEQVKKLATDTAGAETYILHMIAELFEV